MKIYIASSWKNAHGVEMLTSLLRNKGHEVHSWIENGLEEWESYRNHSFDEWVETDHAQKCFEFDLAGATRSDLFIYYAPAGQDASAELGAAWATGVNIIGLDAKGEGIGLMRKMVAKWYRRPTEILAAVDELVSQGREIEDYMRTAKLTLGNS